MKTLSILLGITVLLPALTTAGTVVEQRLQTYQSQGAGHFNVDAGRKLWTQKFTQANGESRACTNCHTADLRQTGKHAATGKTIEAMSPAINPQRLTDADKIEKWFGRNCKWTMGRECTAQEKGDFLSYIQNQ
ncbi:MAG: DUF1924 domain-containing protein [Gammaproteobacteria bacterium]|nr:MAG: DUF1924 domain-containing protein [Gammaproteobacteria bacterium]